MRIAVFGASGNVGGHLARLALAAGHQVTAVVRSSASYDAPPAARVETGDVLDPALAMRVVPSHDVIVSCVGMRYAHPFAKRMSPDDFTERATRNLVDAMKAAGVSRIAIVSTGGAGDSYVGLNWFMRIMLKISNVGVAYADLERAEAVLAESGLDWQAVRPTALSHHPATGRVAQTARFRVTDRIPREDVARWMLAELERPAFSARTPQITSA